MSIEKKFAWLCVLTLTAVQFYRHGWDAGCLFAFGVVLGIKLQSMDKEP